MVETDRNERLERLKAALLKWKEAHETEYNTFARSMRSGDASCYMRFYRSIVLMMPKFRKRWKHDWDSDTVDSFDDITIMVKKSDLPQDIVDKCVREDDSELPDSALPVSLLDKLRELLGMKPKPRVRLSMPLVMCWLYFGKSFELMVEMLDCQLSSKDADTMDKEKCSIAVKAVIKASLSGGYRTQHDWTCYFARKMPLIQEMPDGGQWKKHGRSLRSLLKRHRQKRTSKRIQPRPPDAANRGICLFGIT